MIIPLENRVVIKPGETADVTSGGIILPDQAKNAREGTIVAVGPGKVLNDGTYGDMTVEVGDKVLYYTGGAQEVTIEGETYVVLHDDTLVAVLEEE